MLDLKAALSSSFENSISLESMISQMIHKIFCGNVSEEDIKTCFSSDGLNEVRHRIHKSGIIDSYVSKSHFSVFSKSYLEYCYNQNLLEDHTSQDWDRFYQDSFSVAAGVLNDPYRCTTGRWNCRGRLSAQEYNAILCSTRGDSNLNWSHIFDGRFKDKKIEYFGEIESIILRFSCKKVGEQVVSIIEDTNFSKNFCAAGRLAFYNEAINCGLLTKKIARKIRSDQSENTSLQAISLIISTQKNKPGFTEILPQIVDTNHSVIARHLADHLDFKYLPFMAGTIHSRAREIVANRMMQNSENK